MADQKIHSYTEDALTDPVCLLCGVMISATDDLGRPCAEMDDPGFKQHWKRFFKPGPEHFIVSSDEAENVYIDNFPLLWSCSYRALIKDSDTKYRLTGINSLGCYPWPCYALNDPTKARLSGKKNPRRPTQVFTPLYPGSISRQPEFFKDKTIGYIVHTHCWTLFGRTGGLRLNNVNLAKLVRVCRKYWRRKENYEWWSLPPGCIATSELPSSSEDDLDVSQSPLVVPAIQQAMASAKTECDQPISDFSILPLELMALISEYVCPIVDYTVDDVQNLRNMLLGFGWELPSWFWRVRLDERLFFELVESSENPPVDWKVRLNLMSLIADREELAGSGLVNRERVLGIMFALKDAYMK